MPGFEWVDEAADAAAEILRAADHTPRVIGHTDWGWQNVCVVDSAFVAGYDWDSLAYAPEPAIVGLNAGAFTQGSPVPPDAPTAAEVTAFLDDYERCRSFSPAERRTAEAAATWVRCYNARCSHLPRHGLKPQPDRLSRFSTPTRPGRTEPSQPHQRDHKPPRRRLASRVPPGPSTGH